jgi:hypothetical protein
MAALDSLNIVTKSVIQVIVPPPGGGTVTVSYTLTVQNWGAPLPPSISVAPDARFTLTQAERSFRPRDARDPLAVSLADGSEACVAPGAVYQPSDNCHPGFTALLSLIGAPGNLVLALNATATFTLEPTLGHTWLAGSSTNASTFSGGATADTTAYPDYIFEASQNPNLPAPDPTGLTIVVPQFTPTVNPALRRGSFDGLRATPKDFPGEDLTNLVVTSRDYGGAANLRATITILGMTFPADIVDPDNKNALVTTFNANCGAGTFASIPVDADCDGIADSWEDLYSTQNGVHLPANWDQEPGFGTTPWKGDGYSVHDEYRGFHFMSDDGKTKSIWSSTDPVNNVDVFFWDQSNQFTQPLRQILCQQSASYVCQQSPNYAFRRVSASQAQAKTSNKPTGGVSAMNRNSITASSQTGYAVVYASEPLQRAKFAMPAGADPSSMALGEAEQPLPNTGRPIRIDMYAIGLFVRTSNFPQATLVAEVVAHETGHRFGQRHPLREQPNCCTFVPLGPNQLGMLTLGQVAFPGNKASYLYVRLAQYKDTSNTTRLGDGIASNNPVKIGPAAVQLADSPNTPVYKVSLSGSLLAPLNGFYVQTQQLELMDWTPNLNLTAPGQWHFDPSNNLCVRTPCTQP